jgi:NADPH-dependent curcumin reductase CurA
MNAVANRQLLLRRRPSGLVSDEDFELREAPAPRAGPGEVVVRALYLSFDPTQRGWLNDAPGYMPPVQIGEPMRAGAIGQVVDSQRADFAAGDLVQGLMSWQDYVLVGGKAAEGLSRVRGRFPLTWHLGVLGMTGMTAYFGMLDVGKVRAGDTVAVSGAAGATGSVAGQIAKIAGCRVIGIAGGPEKCRWLTETAGFDAAVDYKSEKVRARLAELAPRGIDVFFDNVGGAILDAALARLANRARVVLCGGISRSNAVGPTPGPANYFNLVFRRARMEGFIVVDYAPRFAEAARELEAWVQAGRLKYREHVVEGFEKLPDALIGIFQGENIGKQMVRIA